ncbi:MAG: hypothetical protein KDK08_05350 [Rhizobiaceae bacterium]|nr:hypothetical protein [Rhizobiaceae bacterium]MCC0000895.1 hypothetical protein [Methylobacteriaceae bacterium]
MRLYRADWHTNNDDEGEHWEWFGTQAEIKAKCKFLRENGFTITRARPIDLPDRKEELIAFLNLALDDANKQGIHF